MAKHLRILGMMIMGGIAGAIELPLLTLMVHLPFFWVGYQANAPFAALWSIIVADIMTGVALGAWLGMPTGGVIFLRKQDPKEAGRACIMSGVVAALIFVFWVTQVSKLLLAGNPARFIGGSIALLPIVGLPVLWIILLFVWGFRLLHRSHSLE